MAHGTSCRVASRAFSIPQSTVHLFIHRVADELFTMVSRVWLPLTEEEHEKWGRGLPGLHVTHPALEEQSE